MVLHVMDAAARTTSRTASARRSRILNEIGAGELPVEIVLNKIDLVDPLGRRRLANRFRTHRRYRQIRGRPR